MKNSFVRALAVAVTLVAALLAPTGTAFADHGPSVRTASDLWCC